MWLKPKIFYVHSNPSAKADGNLLKLVYKSTGSGSEVYFMVGMNKILQHSYKSSTRT